MHRPIRLTVIAILLFGMLATLARESADAMSLRQLQDKLRSTTHNIRQMQAQLRTTKKRQQAATKQVVFAQRRLGVHRARLTDIRGQLARTRAALAKAKADLAIVQARLDRRNELLAARLADTYKHGNVSYVSVLLGSEDLWDLLSRGYVLRKVLDGDVELVESIKEDRQSVLRYKNMLQQKERERMALEQQQASVTQAALHDTRQKQSFLQQIDRDRAAYEQALAEFQRASDSLGARIRAMQRTPAGQKRAASPWRGGYICPIASSYRITSQFGWRIHPIHRVRRFHEGVDLACPSGTPIRAAAGGVVIVAANYGPYGKHVVVDHGGRISTLYGHCSRLQVSVGMKVRQGQVIANVGSTGLSTGPHLHFGKLRDGSPISPM